MHAYKNDTQVYYWVVTVVGHTMSLLNNSDIVVTTFLDLFYHKHGLLKM